MTEPLFEWVTVKEYALIRKVHERTVWRWIRKGLLDATRDDPNGHWRIKVPRDIARAS